jgi:hypothetical protein
MTAFGNRHRLSGQEGDQYGRREVALPRSAACGGEFARRGRGETRVGLAPREETPAEAQAILIE